MNRSHIALLAAALGLLVIAPVAQAETYTDPESGFSMTADDNTIKFHPGAQGGGTKTDLWYIKNKNGDSALVRSDEALSHPGQVQWASPGRHAAGYQWHDKAPRKSYPCRYVKVNKVPFGIISHKHTKCGESIVIARKYGREFLEDGDDQEIKGWQCAPRTRKSFKCSKNSRKIVVRKTSDHDYKEFQQVVDRGLSDCGNYYSYNESHYVYASDQSQCDDMIPVANSLNIDLALDDSIIGYDAALPVGCSSIFHVQDTSSAISYHYAYKCTIGESCAILQDGAGAPSWYREGMNFLDLVDGSHWVIPSDDRIDCD